MFASVSSSTGIEPGISVLVTERYYLHTSDQETVTSCLHRQTGKGTRAGDQSNEFQCRQNLQQTGLLQENTVQWLSNEELQWKFPQINYDINLIINLFRESTASISTGTGEKSNYNICDENQHSRLSMRPLFLEALLRASSSEVPPSTSNSEPICFSGNATGTLRTNSRLPRCVKITVMMPSSGYSAHRHTSL